MVAIEPSKASKVRAFLSAHPDATDSEISKHFGIALSEVRGHRNRMPKLKKKSVAPHLRPASSAVARS